MAQITDRDLELLGFIAAHRFVFAAHAKVFLNASRSVTLARLRTLSDRGLVTRDWQMRQYPPHYQVTRAGLHLIGSELPRPRIDRQEFEHDLGLAWLWLAARGGAFGELREIVAERELRSRDGRRESGEPPLAVRLGGFGPAGRDRLHYPDLLLVDREGRRIALELELTPKSRARREKILSGYAVDARIDEVVYLVESKAIGRSIDAAARKLGVSGFVRVAPVQARGCRQSLSGERGRTRPAPTADARPSPSARRAEVAL